MPNCAVAGCKNYSQLTRGTDIRYFHFPKNEDIVKQWIVACGRSDKINLKHACLCSVHFELHCFETPLKHRLLGYNPKNTRNLKLDALPTINISRSEPQKCSKERSAHMREVDHIIESCTSVENQLVECNSNDANIQEFVQMTQSEQEIYRLKEQILTLEMDNSNLLRKNKELTLENSELLNKTMNSKMVKKKHSKHP